MITREVMLTLISEEKEIYAAYSQSCAHYKVNQNPLASTMHLAKIETLEMLLKMISKQ